MRGDLVTLSAVKAWLGITTSDADAILRTLITQISRAIYNLMNRSDILPRTMVEYYDGLGGNRQLLREWPVTAVNAVIVNTTTIPAASLPGPSVTPSSGWVLEPGDDAPPGSMQSLILRDYTFWKGVQNVYVNYDAGYKIVNDPYTIPGSPYQVSPTHPFGTWGSDLGVKFSSNNASLVAVASNPAAGQYAVSTDGQYTFNSADTNKGVLISYGYIPAALEHVALEWISYMFRGRDRIGMQSKSLGGQETVSYVVKDAPAFVTSALRNFTKVVTP